MKRYAFWIFAFITISCIDNKLPSPKYLNFIKNNKTNYYQIGTRINLDIDFDKLSMVDTLLLRPLNLIDDESTEYKIPTLSEFKCCLLGIYSYSKFDCIITHSYTTMAGSGNPQILISTFTKKGKTISRVRYQLTGQSDYTPVPEQFFTFNNNKKISFELIEKNFSIVDSLGTEKLKYINTTYSNEFYIIDDSGEILSFTKRKS